MSQLLALPRELRDIIYEYTFDGDHCHIPNKEPYAKKRSIVLKFSHAPLRALFLVNKQISAEYQQSTDAIMSKESLHLEIDCFVGKSRRQNETELLAAWILSRTSAAHLDRHSKGPKLLRFARTYDIRLVHELLGRPNRAIAPLIWIANSFMSSLVRRVVLRSSASSGPRLRKTVTAFVAEPSLASAISQFLRDEGFLFSTAVRSSAGWTGRPWPEIIERHVWVSTHDSVKKELVYREARNESDNREILLDKFVCQENA